MFGNAWIGAACSPFGSIHLSVLAPQHLPNVKFPLSLINSHCTVVTIFLKEKVFSTSFNPRISRYLDDADHGVCIPLWPILWCNLQLWYPLGCSFPSNSPLPHSIPTNFCSISDLTANSLPQDDPPEQQSKRVMGTKSLFGQVCRNKSVVWTGDDQERLNLWRIHSIKLAAMHLSEKKLSSSPSFVVDCTCYSVMEIPAQAFWAGESWWFLYYLLPHGLFRSGDLCWCSGSAHCVTPLNSMLKLEFCWPFVSLAWCFFVFRLFFIFLLSGHLNETTHIVLQNN